MDLAPDPTKCSGSGWIRLKLWIQNPGAQFLFRWFRFRFTAQNDIFDHNTFVHSFFLCGLDLVFQHKMAFFYHNPFVHSFFLALKLHNFVSCISIDGIDCHSLEKKVVLMKICKNKMEFTDFLA